MKKGTKDKIVAGIGTVWFLSLVTTNANPKLWQIALIGIALYETLQIAVRIARRESMKARHRKNSRMREQDARAWAEEWFNPYKGVRA